MDSPRHLRTEFRPEPLGVPPEAPLFGWQAPPGVAVQSAYRLRVSADPGVEPLWDSGAVEGDAASASRRRRQ